MYFSANAGDGFHIWRQQSPEGQPEQITFGPTEEEGLAIAPDGRSAITSVGLRQRAVWIHDAAGEREASGFAFGQTYVLPLVRGSYLSRVPPGGFQTEAELASVPNVVILPHSDLAPGPSPAVYAFSRTTITRNLYRIPLP